MPTRIGSAQWRGSIGDGDGTVRVGDGVFEGTYSTGSRFEDGEGTNPEELIAAAHAGCFSMALSAALTRGGHPPTRIDTTARVSIDKQNGDWEITSVHLDTEAEVPDIGTEDFQGLAAGAKDTCPVSKALAGPQISLEARLVG